jgi:hypothetical protein
MAQRLATEYVKTCLQLTEAELYQFMQLFAEHHITYQVKVFDNGNQEIVFLGDGGEQFVMSFERKGGYYVANGSCRINNIKLANLMRKVISQFKGDAIVNRLYPYYTMVYYYKYGSVSKILEVKDSQERVVYEYKTAGELEQLFRNKQVEAEIQSIQREINDLLDDRNGVTDEYVHRQIDEQLKELTHKLFILEA